MNNLKNEFFNEYKIAVGECLYYSALSRFKDEEAEIIWKNYKINFTENYEEFIEQFADFNYTDLENILGILDIEADNDFTNANRCEARALSLGEYFKKLSA